MPSCVTIEAFVSPRAVTSATARQLGERLEQHAAGRRWRRSGRCRRPSRAGAAASPPRSPRRRPGMRAHAGQQLLGPRQRAVEQDRALARRRRRPRSRPGSSPPPSRRARRRRARGSVSHATRSSSMVVTPSASNSFRGRLRADAREPHDLDEARRDTSPPACSSAFSVPVSRSSSTFAAIVSPTSGSSVSRPSSDRRIGRLAGLAEPRRRLAIGEHAVDDGAVQLVEVAEPVDDVGEIGVTERHDGQSYGGVRGAPILCLPATYDERENLRAHGRRAGDRARRRRRSRRARHRRRLAGRHRRDRRRARARPARGCTCCTGPRRRGSAAPTWRLPLGARARLRRTCSRWTATSPTTRRRVPALRDAAAAGADLALGLALRRRRRHGQLGPRAPDHLARRLPLRAPRARAARARPDGRLQVLPPARCSRRSTLDEVRRRGLRVPDRDDLPRARCSASRVVEVPIVFSDRVARRLEDVAADRRRGRVARPAAAVSRAARPDSAYDKENRLRTVSCSNARTVVDHDRGRRGGGRRGRRLHGLRLRDADRLRQGRAGGRRDRRTAPRRRSPSQPTPRRCPTSAWSSTAPTSPRERQRRRRRARDREPEAARRQAHRAGRGPHRRPVRRPADGDLVVHDRHQGAGA